MIVQFTKGYAGAKKGDILEFDSIMGSKLINKYKVAKVYRGEDKPKNMEIKAENKNAAPATEDKSQKKN